MADTVSELSHVTARLRRFAAERSWERFHTPKNLSTALVVEASELAEIFQWLTPEESVDVMKDEADAFRVRDEIADVLAYLLQIAAVCGVDPVEALNDKIDRNETRFTKTV
jgi:NTP pyrophosphatase (non-canonical NTP hydrolase)